MHCVQLCDYEWRPFSYSDNYKNDTVTNQYEDSGSESLWFLLDKNNCNGWAYGQYIFTPPNFSKVGF